MFRFLRTYRSELTDTFRLSVPIVIAQLGVVLMGVTDNLFVGRLLGAVPLGAAGLANAISFLVSCIGVGGLSVVAALVSKARSQNDTAEVNRLFRAGLQVAWLFSIVFGGLSIVLAYNFQLFGQTPEVTKLAENFMLILSASLVPLLIFVAARQLADGLRFPRVAMAITVGALVLNAFFNYVLITGFGPFPEMGLMGSAMATLLSRTAMAVGMLVYIYRSGRFKPYLVRAFRALPTSADVRTILRLGIPGGLTFFFEVATFTLAAVLTGWLGEDRLAAHQIAINMASVTYMMATGISSAAAIRVGAAVGQGSNQGVYRAGVAAFALSIGFMSVAALLFFTANDWLVSLYIRDNPAVSTVAATLVIMGGIFQLSDGIQVVGVGALRGLSDVNVPTLITLFSYWGVALPMSYLLGFTFKMDVIGVWIGLLAGLTIAAILLTVRFFRRVRRLERTVSGIPA
ncbi:MATE family efflux transporter [Spirosoma utsteinense]|uniref:Multidrug-efflux transporter n=1 Tax=Spirosoma utsteinense TaxID=2585773 RepID=A0ABR6W9I0_9BACT|nr:MATE family efflux transporter [Spirosoma utsteinense]MBC3787626.1 MATE family multidrug resistance protein [Spirosoma utsteinense]MBC3793222.1 MATE family multidrug resistance protein [Spirosoma utsteinense]